MGELVDLRDEDWSLGQEARVDAKNKEIGILNIRITGLYMINPNEGVREGLRAIIAASRFVNGSTAAAVATSAAKQGEGDLIKLETMPLDADIRGRDLNASFYERFKLRQIGTPLVGVGD
mmetsp:Transcript_7610/g.19386  ORF Transcript_7610/g.19386 Transcript_7610/m.19386 type:complete len:120 (+) Transcript_7610:149-508(+)